MGFLFPPPQYPEWYLPRTPQSPSLNSSTGILTDSWETSTQRTSPPEVLSQSRFHKKRLAHLCLSQDCYIWVDWEVDNGYSYLL